MVDKLKETKQVDSYVAMLLETYKTETNTDIDPKNPSREDRILAAMDFDNKGDKWSAVEIMVGGRIDSESEEAITYNFLIVAQALCPQNTRKFYEGFPETQ